MTDEQQRMSTPGFVNGWDDNILNIHSSLLPAFRGAHAHADALAAGVKITGCTVHVVRPEMDSGPILVQAAVPVHPDDTEDSLAARVLEAEHFCYPFAVRAIAEGRERVSGMTATIRSVPVPVPTCLVSPGQPDEW